MIAQMRISSVYRDIPSKEEIPDSYRNPSYVISLKLLLEITTIDFITLVDSCSVPEFRTKRLKLTFWKTFSQLVINLFEPEIIKILSLAQAICLSFYLLFGCCCFDVFVKQDKI